MFEMEQFLHEQFPEQAGKLAKASTLEEFNAVHTEMLNEARGRLREALAKSGLSETAADSANFEGDSLPVVLLTEDEYPQLRDASGDTLKALLQKHLNAAKAVSEKKNESAKYITALMIANKMLVMGEKKHIKQFKDILEEKKINQDTAVNNDDIEEIRMMIAEIRGVNICELDGDPLVGPIVMAAVLTFVTTVTVAVIAVIASFIVIAILVPLLCFMFKEAYAIVFVMNEMPNPDSSFTKNSLVLDNSANYHGKQLAYTMDIPPAIQLEDSKFVTGGFFTTSKRDMALFGTAYGVKLDIKDANKSVAFGVERPLNGNSKCYCAFNTSAEDASEKVMDAAGMSSEASEGNYKALIKMHSTNGPDAYYIARVYNA